MPDAKTTGVEMDRRRRRGEPEDVDHTPERVIDWRRAAPPWILVTALLASFGLNGFLGSIVWHQFKWEWQRTTENPLLKKVADLEQADVEIRTRMRQYEQLMVANDVRMDVTEIKAAMREMRAEMRLIVRVNSGEGLRSN